MQLMRGTDIGTPKVADVRGDADSLDVMELQRQCRALQASKARIEGAEIALSACFGVAMLRGGESGVSILAEADREMYSAKRYNLASHVLPELEAAS
jgi:GGDEF domain-containing protein